MKTRKSLLTGLNNSAGVKRREWIRLVGNIIERFQDKKELEPHELREMKEDGTSDVTTEIAT